MWQKNDDSPNTHPTVRVMGCVSAKVSGSPEGNIGGKHRLEIIFCVFVSIQMSTGERTVLHFNALGFDCQATYRLD